MQKLGSMPDPELQPSASHACSWNFKQDSVAHLVATVRQGLAKDADSQAPPPLPQLESRHLASAQVILRRTHCSMRMSCRKKSASTDWPPVIASLKNNRRHSLDTALVASADPSATAGLPKGCPSCRVRPRCVWSSSHHLLPTRQQSQAAGFLLGRHPAKLSCYFLSQKI